jgi:hypothetical protein
MKKTKKNNNSIIYIVAVILILILAFIFSKKSKQNEQQAVNNLFDKEIILDVQEFKDQGTEHISGSGNFEYNSNPPTSGPHYGQAPRWGFYREPIDDESALHAVEHGGIWVSYNNLNQDEIDLLKEFANTNAQSVIVTPRDQNNSRISAVAWTKIVEFESVDVDALQKFLLLNKNKTHEPLAK